MERELLNNFKKYMRGKVDNLDLIVACDIENYEETHSFEIMETKDNGRVWTVETTKSGKIKSVFEI